MGGAVARGPVVRGGGGHVVGPYRGGGYYRPYYRGYYRPYYGYGYGYGYGDDEEAQGGLLRRLRRNKGGPGADQPANGGPAETPEAKSKTPV